MGPVERRTARTDDRYGTKRANADPVDLPRAKPVGRTDLALLLGRTVLEARVQQVCKEYALVPRSGDAVGSGLSRAYLSREAGVELAADPRGMVTTVFLHFDGDDGFNPFQGEIPGGAGRVPRRTHLWAMLGRPDEQGDGPWDRWVLAGFALHAQYGADGERLDLVTLALPQRPLAA
jgi:hypothetical protein